MSALPKGWAETTLGEIVSLRGDKADPGTMPDVPFIGLEDIEPHTSTILHVGKAADVKSAVARFEAGDVLYSRLRPYLNKVTVPDFDGVASAEILALCPNSATTSEFVRRRIMTGEFLDFAALLDKGDRPRVNYKEIATFPVALPPFPEQGRIVAKVDGLTARTARARKELDRIPTLIARYKQRLLALAFSGELTADWRADHRLREPVPTTVDDLSEGLRYGTAQKSYAEPNGVAVLRIPNVASGRISLEDLKYSELEPREFAKLRLNEGDILVVRSNGSVDLVGRPALVTGDAVGLAYAGYLIRIRPKHDVVMPKFLTLMLEAPAIRSIIEAGARSTSGVNNVNATELGALSVPLFDIDEQAEIVRRIDSAFGWLGRMAADHAAAVRLLPKLDAAILAKAFRGELVPQDPSDEPASVLLERINAEREARDAKPQQGRGRPRVHHLRGEGLTVGVVLGTATITVGQENPRNRAMTKSRQDEDVMGKPYLAGIVKQMGEEAAPEALFARSNLELVDFYRQLDFECAQGWLGGSQQGRVKAA